MICLQEQFAPKSTCFGCGPENKKGLQIRSFAPRDAQDLASAEVITEWKASSHHEAFAGSLNGGIIGTLFDCHSNWTAAWHLMNRNQLKHPPCTVTAEYAIRLKRPTPTQNQVQIRARVVESKEDRASTEAELWADGKICATCTGLFVAVKEGHPAFHRW